MDAVDLFTEVFSNSEGAQEGRLIGKLVSNLLKTTHNDDIYMFCATENNALAGCILFTRVTFADDRQTVFMLSPVAVDTRHQGKGVGAALINFGLGALRNDAIDVAITYGDPNYYRRVGFEPVSQTIIPAPFALSQPEGWLAQSLTDGPLQPMQGPPRCVDAFNDPDYW